MFMDPTCRAKPGPVQRRLVGEKTTNENLFYQWIYQGFTYGFAYSLTGSIYNSVVFSKGTEDQHSGKNFSTTSWTRPISAAHFSDVWLNFGETSCLQKKKRDR
ncbi:uncharacterized protein LOC135143018 [Zophobas morio]|uniref:uncharacterized protein LOC135143018 n=1 Tax=Zophobas morio TaxID=2755281 RepID=UPI0030829E12